MDWKTVDYEESFKRAQPSILESSNNLKETKMTTEYKPMPITINDEPYVVCPITGHYIRADRAEPVNRQMYDVLKFCHEFISDLSITHSNGMAACEMFSYALRKSSEAITAAEQQLEKEQKQ
jgi:hypothetical protein